MPGTDKTYYTCSKKLKRNHKIFFTHTLEEHLSPQEFTTPDEKIILHTYL